MKVSIGQRAQQQAERIDQQWREAADYPGLFASEFAAMIEDLETITWLGQRWPTDGMRLVGSPPPPAEALATR